MTTQIVELVGVALQQGIIEMIDNFKILKGGKLVCDKWNRELRQREKEIDISKYLMYHLRDECELDTGVTLKDILTLIKPFEQELSPVLTYGENGIHLLEEESNKDIEEDEGCKDMKIVLSRDMGIVDDFDDKNKSMINEFIHVCGKKEGDSDTYALNLTPLNNIANSEVRLDYNVTIYDERKKVKNKYFAHRDSLSEKQRANMPFYPVVMNTTKKFTLLDILHGIFCELTFFGPPDKRDEKKQQLIETCRRINSGEEKTIPWEEVKKRLNKTIGKVDEEP